MSEILDRAEQRAADIRAEVKSYFPIHAVQLVLFGVHNSHEDGAPMRIGILSEHAGKLDRIIRAQGGSVVIEDPMRDRSVYAWRIMLTPEAPIGLEPWRL